MSSPNILMITCHDLGQHLGCYGVKAVCTDNIDKLAEKGCRFVNYFATAPTCSPSRGSILTGRYPQSNGLMGLAHQPWGWEFNEGEKYLPSILSEAGYETILVGLQHVTKEDPHMFGYHKALSERLQAEETVNIVKKLLRRAKKGDRPFFMQVGFREVHRPFDDSNPYIERGVYIPHYLKDTQDIREDLTRFQEKIRFLDECVGEIIEHLGKSKVAGDTMVIFTSDHGIPYIGAKWTLFDPGLETPLIMYHPRSELQGGKTYSQLMSNVDLMPTLLGFIDIEAPDNSQGTSFKEVITGVQKDSPRKEVFAQHTSHALRDNLSRCIRTERYKLIRYFEPGRPIIFPTDAHPQRVARHIERPKRIWMKRPIVQLFDLKEDPNERDDLAVSYKHADILRDLSDRLWRWMEEVGDPLLHGPLVTPYYKEAMEDYHRYRSERIS